MFYYSKFGHDAMTPMLLEIKFWLINSILLKKNIWPLLNLMNSSTFYK